MSAWTRDTPSEGGVYWVTWRFDPTGFRDWPLESCVTAQIAKFDDGAWFIHVEGKIEPLKEFLAARVDVHWSGRISEGPPSLDAWSPEYGFMQRPEAKP